ncbi:MAG TPA: hypothetical protein VHE35_21005 [Kofleriaceae bacterium]|nr:hypothetical protein [Kofleriaceae bacterium]
MPTTRLRYSAAEPELDSADRAWTIVLAGEEDEPATPGAAAGGPSPVPRAYVRAGDIRSMLEQTLDRLGQLTPPSRILTVVGPNHLELARAQLRGRSDHVFCQPMTRDTGFGLYVALAMVRRWAPRAVVTITPVGTRLPVARTGIAHLSVARRLAALLADQIVVIGGNPPAPGRVLPCVPAVAGVGQVGRAQGVASMADGGTSWQVEQDGAPWCIASACASVDATWELGRVTSPRLLEILDSLVPLVGTPDEDDAIDYIYRAFRPVNFARDMIGRAPWRCVTMPLDGSPARWETVLDPGRAARPSSRRMFGERPLHRPS